MYTTSSDFRNSPFNSLKYRMPETDVKNSPKQDVLSSRIFSQKRQKQKKIPVEYFNRNSSEEFNKLLLNYKPSNTEPPDCQRLWEQYILLKQMFKTYHVTQEDGKPRNKNKACTCKPLGRSGVYYKRNNSSDLYPTKENSFPAPFSSSILTQDVVTKNIHEATEMVPKKNIIKTKNNLREHDVDEINQAKEETLSEERKYKAKNNINEGHYDSYEIIQSDQDDEQRGLKDKEQTKMKNNEKATKNGKLYNTLEELKSKISDESSKNDQITSNKQQRKSNASQESLTVSELLEMHAKAFKGKDPQYKPEVDVNASEEPKQIKKGVQIKGDSEKIELVLPFDFDHLCQHSSGKEIKLLLCNNDKYTCQCAHCGTGIKKANAEEAKEKDESNNKKDGKDVKKDKKKKAKKDKKKKDKKEKKEDDKPKKKEKFFACCRKKKPKNERANKQASDKSLQALTEDEKKHTVLSTSYENVEDLLKTRFEICCKCGKMDIDKPLNGCSIDTLKMLIKMEAKQNYRQINNIIKELNEHKTEIRKLQSIYEKLTSGDISIINGTDLEQDIKQLYKLYNDLKSKVYSPDKNNILMFPNGSHSGNEDYLPEKDILLPDKGKSLKSKIEKDDPDLDSDTLLKQENINKNNTVFSGYQKNPSYGSNKRNSKIMTDSYTENYSNNGNTENSKNRSNGNISKYRPDHQKTEPYYANMQFAAHPQHPLGILHEGTDIPSFHLAKCPCQINWDLYHEDTASEEENPKEKTKCKVKLRSIFCNTDNSDKSKCDMTDSTEKISKGFLTGKKSDNNDKSKCNMIDAVKKASKGILANLKKSTSKLIAKIKKKDENPKKKEKDIQKNSTSTGVLKEGSVESLFRKDFVVYSIRDQANKMPEKDRDSSAENSAEQIILNKDVNKKAKGSLEARKSNSILIWLKKISHSDEKRSVNTVNESLTSTSSSRKILGFVNKLYKSSKKKRISSKV